MAWLLMAWIPLSPVHAADKARQEDVYDSLQESIEKNWTDGFEHLEATDEIEVKGPLMERILRSIANVFYRHLVGIKGWSLFIGVISLVVGVFIAVNSTVTADYFYIWHYKAGQYIYIGRKGLFMNTLQNISDLFLGNQGNRPGVPERKGHLKNTSRHSKAGNI